MINSAINDWSDSADALILNEDADAHLAWLQSYEPPYDPHTIGAANIEQRFH